MNNAPYSKADRKIEVLQSMAAAVTRNRLSVPAIFMLETLKPLSTLIHAGTLVSAPFLSMLFGAAKTQDVTAILESREDVEKLIRLIEEQAATGIAT